MRYARRLAQAIGLTVLLLGASPVSANATTLDDLAVPSTVAVGEEFDLAATISPASSGTGTFRIYEDEIGPNTCVAPSRSIEKSVSDATTITAPDVSVTPVGGYWVTFEFQENGPDDIDEDCGAGKPLRIAPRQPGIDLAVPSTAIPGTPFTVKAVLTGAFHPTGAIGLWVYDAKDTTCSVPVKVVPDLSVNEAEDGVSLTLAAGTYRIGAKYGNDNQNKDFVTPCGQAKPVKVETPAAPATNGGTPAPQTSPLTIGATTAVTTRGKPLLRLPRKGSFVAQFQVRNTGAEPMTGKFKLTFGRLKLYGALPKGKGLSRDKDGSVTWEGAIPAGSTAPIPAIRLRVGKAKRATLAIAPVGATAVAATDPALELVRETRRVKLDPPQPQVLKRGGSTRVTLRAVVDVAVCSGAYRVQYAGTIGGKTRRPFTDQKRPKVVLRGKVCEVAWSSTFVPAVFSFQRLTFAIKGPKGDKLSNRVVLRIKR